jgi:hypothetical protein
MMENPPSAQVAGKALERVEVAQPEEKGMRGPATIYL